MIPSRCQRLQTSVSGERGGQFVECNFFELASPRFFDDNGHNRIFMALCNMVFQTGDNHKIFISDEGLKTRRPHVHLIKVPLLIGP